MAGLVPWRQWFPDRAVNDGRVYARDGKVDGLAVGASGAMRTLQATVHGHSGYRVLVGMQSPEAVGDGLRTRTLTTRCTCPVGDRCKHAAAVLWQHELDIGIVETLEADDDDASGAPDGGDEPDETAPRDRQGPSAASTRAAIPVGATRSGRSDLPLDLVAALRAEGMPLAWMLTGAGLAWRLEPFLPRDLKRGGVGIARRWTGNASLLQRVHAWGSPEDHQAVIALAAWRDPWRPAHDGVLDLCAGASAPLLERLLRSGRVRRSGTEMPPVVLGPARRATLDWVEAAAGTVRPALRGEDGAAIVDVLPLDPPWYVADGVTGPLTVDAPAAALAMALRLQPAGRAALAAVRPWFERHLPALADGLPTAPAPMPTAVLTWCRTRRWTAGAMVEARFEALVPLFRYGATLVPPSGELLREHADGTPVARDLVAEADRLAELGRLGLQPAPTALQPSYAGCDAQVDGRDAAAFVAEVAPANPRADSAPAPQPLPTTTLAALRLRGWEIVGSAGAGPADTATVVDADALQARVADGDRPDAGWFELHLGIEVNGQRVDLVPLLEPLLAGDQPGWERLPRATTAAGEAVILDAGPGRTLAVPVTLLVRLREALLSLYARPRGPDGGLRVDAADLATVADGTLGRTWEGSPAARATIERLRACLQPQAVEAPRGLGVTLRPYQREGLGWLMRLRELGLGGLLADDMGLGKTLQAIASIEADREAGRLDGPVLVLCPTSMLGTWERELARAAPALSVAVHHGARRERAPTPPAGTVLVTSYATAVRDAAVLRPVAWHLVVCDEAQALKNSATRTAAMVRSLRARHRLCLTGTPVENHLGELHGYVDWLVPGLLGSRAAFTRDVGNAIESGEDPGRAAWLRRRLAPFVLRRTKAAVAADLPSRSEAEVPVTLGERQRAAYESVRLAMDARVREAIAARGAARSHLEVLEALLRLRQICCDPRLAGLEIGDEQPGKLAHLRGMLPSLIEDGRRILLFSQFTGFLDLIESEVVRPLGTPWLRLDGSTRGRQALVDRFQAGEAPLFLISLKAGGTGLTLTAADTVIIADPWWNPAAEQQAIDRTHRIGQDKPVIAYRLVAAGTVEERILALQERKRRIAASVHGDDGQSLGRLDEADIAALLGPMA